MKLVFVFFFLQNNIAKKINKYILVIDILRVKVFIISK